MRRRRHRRHTRRRPIVYDEANYYGSDTVKMMQQSARHRYRSYEDSWNYSNSGSNYYNDVLLAEFRYYNQKTEIIPPDELEKIEKQIRKNPSKVTFWTSKVFGDNRIGFVFFMKTINYSPNDIKEKDIYIRLQKFNSKLRVGSFKTLEKVFKGKIFFSFQPNENMSKILHVFSLDKYTLPIKHGYMAPPFTDWNEFVNHFITTKSFNYFDSCNNNEWPIYKHIVKGLFNFDIHKPNIRVSDDSCYNQENARFIIDVIEKRVNNKNYRVALIAQCDDYISYSMHVFPDTHDDYTFIDKGKLYIKCRDKRYFFDDSTLDFRDGFLLVDLKLMKHVGSNINNVLAEGEKVITPMIYRFYRERVLTGTFTSGELTKQEKALIDRYKVLLKEGRAIKINQVYFTKDMIQVAGEGFKLEFQPEFLDVLEKFGEIKRLIKSDTIYNFNEFYEGLLKMSKLRILDRDYCYDRSYKNFTKTNFIINGMDIEVSKDKSRARINGIFCRLDDILHVLNKCICYHNIDELNQYIKDVSHIGIEWKKMISSGIALQLHNPLHAIVSEIDESSINNLYLRFSLYWDAKKRSHVYLKLSDKKYLIKYKGKFKKHFNHPRRSLTIEQMKQELLECIPDLDDNMLLEIIDNAVEEAKIVRKRGLELVANTVGDVQAKETEINIKGNKIQGYLFFGRQTKGKYFVEKIKLTVFKYIDGSWNRRCIVDDHNKQRIYEDRLANRLINIYNEPAYLANFLKT